MGAHCTAASAWRRDATTVASLVWLGTTMNPTRKIPVRKEDIWTFTQRNVSLWDILDFFPPEAIGPRGPGDPPRPYDVRPVTIETDLGWSFESDIQYGSWVFRPRSPRRPGMMKWCRERNLEEGDALVFERLDERRYRLSLEKGGARTRTRGGGAPGP